MPVSYTHLDVYKRQVLFPRWKYGYQTICFISIFVFLTASSQHCIHFESSVMTSIIPQVYDPHNKLNDFTYVSYSHHSQNAYQFKKGVFRKELHLNSTLLLLLKRRVCHVDSAHCLFYKSLYQINYYSCFSIVVLLNYL